MPVIYLVSVELGVPHYGFVAPTYRFSLLSSALLLSSSQQRQAKSFSCCISFGEGNGTPLQYSCLENPMGRGAWWAAVHGVMKSRSRLSNFTFTFHFHFSPSCIGEGNGNPLQCSCLENPRDRGAWWAAVYGVAQSRTRLKWLSSSSNSSSSISLMLSIFCIPLPNLRNLMITLEPPE